MPSGGPGPGLLALRHEVAHQLLFEACPPASDDRLFHELIVDAALRWAADSPWGRTHAQGASMLPSVRRATKVAVVALGAVAVLAQVGYPVGSLLAGLGLGGLAVALAAQKTVENLIGSVTIGLDVPFKVGDFVRADGAEGTVEAIGLRSTRLRTLDRTVVTIPNGKLADARIETSVTSGARKPGSRGSSRSRSRRFWTNTPSAKSLSR